MRIVVSFLVFCQMFFGFYALNAQAQTLDINGLSDYLDQAEGKQVVVLNFYASWCGPCVSEIPHFVSVRNKFSENDLKMIGVNFDRSIQVMRNFNKKTGINYETVHDDGSIQGYFEINAIPVTVVVGKDGEIVEYHTGYMSERELEKAVRAGM